MAIRFSSLRGDVVELSGGVTVVNDCYNANPMSMQAALEDLAATARRTHHARRVAVLEGLPAKAAVSWTTSVCPTSFNVST